MSRDDPRGMPPVSEEDALDAALNDAMPMIVFWHEAEAKFGADIKDALIEAFDDDLWSIAIQYTDNEDVRHEILDEITSRKIKELTA